MHINLQPKAHNQNHQNENFFHDFVDQLSELGNFQKTDSLRFSNYHSFQNSHAKLKMVDLLQILLNVESCSF